ncbi:MAG: protein-methionine-sulfoxide reductase heme-binding subunit MsrQ, partial [Dehalococcoidales bacterium]
MGRLKRHWLRILVHGAALLPLAALLLDFSQGQLTANPIQEITLRTGRTALILLTMSLAVTPINIVFGLGQLIPFRRTLGLYAFFYACLHLLTFIGLDYRFDFGLMLADVGGKRFVLAGLAAFFSLLILAATSTEGWRKRLGKNRGRLHRLAYLAAALAITHFFWQVKIDYSRPLLYGSVVAVLLLARLPVVRKLLAGLRRRIIK